MPAVKNSFAALAMGALASAARLLTGDSDEETVEEQVPVKEEHSQVLET